ESEATRPAIGDSPVSLTSKFPSNTRIGASKTSGISGRGTGDATTSPLLTVAAETAKELRSNVVAMSLRITALIRAARIVRLLHENFHGVAMTVIIGRSDDVLAGRERPIVIDTTLVDFPTYI